MPEIEPELFGEKERISVRNRAPCPTSLHKEYLWDGPGIPESQGTVAKMPGKGSHGL